MKEPPQPPPTHPGPASEDWAAGLTRLQTADRTRGLDPAELEQLAECARWLGRSEDLIAAMERAHRGYAASGNLPSAARTALSLCQDHGDLSRFALAESWWKRADEIVRGLPEGPVHALHALFLAMHSSDTGDLEAQEAAARRAHGLAQRYADRNVEALAMIQLGHVATARGQTAEAHAAIESATSMAIGGLLGPLQSGEVFCSAIWAYRSRGEWARAAEWTDSASRWASEAPTPYFSGLCRIHRSEVLRIRGELAAAEFESREAVRSLEQDIPRYAVVAHAELGEVRRRRGDLAGAEAAFLHALELGWDPQPGLALLLLEQGSPDAAHRALERAFTSPGCTNSREDRASLLAARTTIALAVDDLPAAELAATELEALADRNDTLWDLATAAHARGEVELAHGRAAAAVRQYSRAHSTWAELEAPFELATTRAALGRALAADGDLRGAHLELGAAERIFARIGAVRGRDHAAATLEGLATSVSASRRRAGPEGPQASLVLEGEYWNLTLASTVIRLKDGRGPRYLAALLARPATSQWSIDLAAGTAHESGGRPRTHPLRGDAGEILDDEARVAFRARLEELQQELDEARDRQDESAVESILHEMDQIGSTLAAAIGLGGRSRRAGGAIERARQSVTKALRGTLRKIATADPELGHYFKATVTTGTACRFDPDPRHPVRWSVCGVGGVGMGGREG